MSRESIILAIVVVFYLLSLVIGSAFTRKASTGFLAFTIANKQLPWYVIMGTAFATYAGTVTFMAWPGSAWKGGVNIGWQMFPNGLGVLLCAMFIVPILVRMSRVTMAEPLGERYSSGVRTVCSALGFARTLGSTANQIIGVAIVISLFAGMNLNAAMIVSWLVLVAYVVLGGQWGVAYADTFQGLIMILSLVVAPIAIIARIGQGSIIEGWNLILKNVPAKHFDMMNIKTNVLIGYLLVQTFGQMLRPELYGRIFAARSAKEGVRGWLIVGMFLPIVLSSAIILGLAARAVIPKLDDAQYAAPQLFLNYAPMWLLILFILGILAAGLSTASSAMMGAANHYVTDFHATFINKNMGDKTAVTVTRVSVVVFSLIALWWAVSWKSIIDIFQFSYTVLVGGLLLPYFGMFFWPRMTTPAAFWSALVGGGLTIVWKFVVQNYKLVGEPWLSLDPVVPALVASVILSVVVSYMTPPEYDKVVKFAETYGLTSLKQRALKAMGEVK
ncbi:MAG: sodium:solute symporter family protein [Bacillota bacterium]